MWYARMFRAMTEGTGKCLVLGRGLFHIFPFLFMARHAKSPRCGHGRGYLQWMMSRMAAETVTGNLAFDMGFMALGTVRDLAMDLVAERTGLFGMGTLVIGKILARALMAGETRFFDVRSKVQGQRFMRVGVAGQAVFKLEMRSSFMTPGTLRDSIFTPWRMLLVAVQTCYFSLMLAAVRSYRCRLILMTFDTVRHFKGNPLCFNLMGKNS